MSMRAIKTTKSSTIAIGAATLFVTTAVMGGLLGQDQPILGSAGWHLRGSFVPETQPATVALPARAKPV